MLGEAYKKLVRHPRTSDAGAVMLEEAYKKLIAQLEEAVKEEEESPKTAQVGMLNAFATFLEDTGNGELAAPASHLLFERYDAVCKADRGGATKPIREIMVLAHSAALITFLVQDCGRDLDTVLREASKYLGLDKRKLNNYRNKLLSRKYASDAELAIYDGSLLEMRAKEL
jgi:hypothetical protein